MQETIIVHRKINPLYYPVAIERFPSHMTMMARKGEGPYIHLTASYCNQKDQFSRAKGRQNAADNMKFSETMYEERMEYYRKGRGTKPSGFRLTVKVEDLTDESFRHAAHAMINDFEEVFLKFYSDQKIEHARRKRIDREAKRTRLI